MAAWCHLQLAQDHLLVRQLAPAMAELTAADAATVARGEELLSAWLSAARLAHEEGQADAERSCLRAALAIDPEQPEAKALARRVGGIGLPSD